MTATRSTRRDAKSVDCGPPSGEADSHRYGDTIKAVFAYNPNITPQPIPVDDVFGGECQETQWEERHPSIPSSGLLSSALRYTGSVMEGYPTHLSSRQALPDCDVGTRRPNNVKYTVAYAYVCLVMCSAYVHVVLAVGGSLAAVR